MTATEIFNRLVAYDKANVPYKRNSPEMEVRRTMLAKLRETGYTVGGSCNVMKLRKLPDEDCNPVQWTANLPDRIEVDKRCK